MGTFLEPLSSKLSYPVTRVKLKLVNVKEITHNMKKLLSAILALTMMFAMVGCGSNNNAGNDAGNNGGNN